MFSWLLHYLEVDLEYIKTSDPLFHICPNCFTNFIKNYVLYELSKKTWNLYLIHFVVLTWKFKEI